MNKLIEAARREIEAHPAYDCGSTGDEEMARAAILAFLQAALEDEGAVEDGAKAMLADDAPKQSFDAAWESEQEIWKQNARSFLRALIARAQSFATLELE